MNAKDFEDRSRFEIVTEHLVLADRKVAVKVYKDRKTGRAYQVDFKSGEYRDSRHVLEPYGDWKKLT